MWPARSWKIQRWGRKKKEEESVIVQSKVGESLAHLRDAPLQKTKTKTKKEPGGQSLWSCDAHRSCLHTYAVALPPRLLAK